ncbi:peptidyl-Lys metalloendopeptidase [Rhizoctonia solani]|uniref:Peptidyl-Lys metalloendopeptidase n=1 Tax=Rhizoctonia solani TaxID=456999 RepID=A0A8H7IFU7_9AGAM|nr:peptidyl-Lys metalloendopeptidase [Rhizoctonia solani]
MRTAFATALVSAAVLGVSAAPVVKNTGTETLKLLKDPRGVLSSAKTHTFNVANEKGSPQFTGMFVKYSPDYVVKKNNAADFTILAPGQTYELTHNLAGVYNFTNTGAGEFKIDASNLFQYVDASGKLASIEASTQSNKVALTGNLVSTRGLPKIESRSLGKRVAYVGCSTTRQSQIATAVTSANSYVSAATSYLNGISSGTTVTPPGSVPTHLPAPRLSALTSLPLVLMLQALPTTAPPAHRVHMHTCTPTSPAVSTSAVPSGAGTIVHEQSHFTVNGGTQDIVYGQSGARSLASSSPDRAIQNADSHEYFAENNPAQS